MADRRTSALVVLLVLATAGAALATGPAPTAAGTDAQVEGAFERHTFEGREYVAYVPSGPAPEGGYPVVVMLHGCGQDPRGFDRATGMSRVAEDEGFVVVYPEQTNAANVFACWNWFEPANYERGAGEARLIAGMTDDALRTYDTNRAKVYIAGLSAGAAMATNVAGEYPDLYAAVGSHSGLEYHAVEDSTVASGAQQTGGIDPANRARRAYQRAGERARPIPTIVFHGENDGQVALVNGNQTVAWAVHLADLATDGTDDGDVDTTPETVETATTAEGVAYTHLGYALDGQTVVSYYLLEDVGHGWSGGNASHDYTVPGGPPASRLLWDFFANHTHPAPTFEGPAPSPTTAAPTDTTATGTATSASGGATKTTPTADPVTEPATSEQTSAPPTSTPTPTSGSGPGFGLLAAMAALAAATGLLVGQRTRQ